VELNGVNLLLFLESSKLYTLNKVMEAPSLVLRGDSNILVERLEGDVGNARCVILDSILLLV
jgi:hypothetical protein